MYGVGLVGLGSIAARYSTPSDPFPYCHAGGIRQCKLTNLVAVADMDEDRQTEFRQTWGPSFSDTNIGYYNNDVEMLKNEKLDIVAVCVRGPFHLSVMKNVLDSDIKIIFLEKPAGCSLQEIDEMTVIAEEKGIPIVVDYSRHWAPHLIRLQNLVQNGLIGKVKTVIGYCSGTVLSFAIHSTDMICQFAGYDPISVWAEVQDGTGSSHPEYEPEPAIVSSTIKFQSGIRGIHIGRHGRRDAFSVDVLGTKGTLTVGYSRGITRLTDESGNVVDHNILNLPDNASVFKVAYQQIVDYLEGGPLPDCSRNSYMAVNEIGFATIESGKTGQLVNLPNLRRDRLVYANG